VQFIDLLRTEPLNWSWLWVFGRVEVLCLEVKYWFGFHLTTPPQGNAKATSKCIKLRYNAEERADFETYKVRNFTTSDC